MASELIATAESLLAARMLTGMGFLPSVCADVSCLWGERVLVFDIEKKKMTEESREMKWEGEDHGCGRPSVCGFWKIGPRARNGQIRMDKGEYWEK